MTKFTCDIGGCLWQCKGCREKDNSEWLRKQSEKEQLHFKAKAHANELYGKIHYLVRNRPHKDSNMKLAKELAHLSINEIIDAGFGEGYKHEYYCLVNRYIDEI